MFLQPDKPLMSNFGMLLGGIISESGIEFGIVKLSIPFLKVVNGVLDNYGAALVGRFDYNVLSIA